MLTQIRSHLPDVTKFVAFQNGLDSSTRSRLYKYPKISYIYLNFIQTVRTLPRLQGTATVLKVVQKLEILTNSMIFDVMEVHN
jgi:hypothetical protein